jgi:cyclopropane-fatty-acyl-phospholipid synthase
MTVGSQAGGAAAVLPAERPLLHGHVAAAVVRRWLASWSGSALAVELPDGSAWRFGEPACGRCVTVTVLDWRFFSRVVARSDVGLGESYMAGEWRCDDLVAFFRSLLVQPAIARRAGWLAWAARLTTLPLRRRSVRRAAHDVRAHYDLGNAFFACFLDESMTYSAAVFPTAETSLAEAQREKLERICRRLGLAPGMEVLDLGGGWGSFAIHAAMAHGCRVRSITLSPAQHALARRRVREAGLDARVDVRLCDYRDVTGRFDRIVSIEMFEAIGFAHYRTFFRACARLLTEDGRMLLQTSTYPDDGFHAYRTDVDWIRTHVFPGGLLASLGAIRETVARTTSLRIESTEEIGPHYATTLHHWRARYLRSMPEVRRLGFDASFVRKWDLYLAMCEAAFAAGRLGTSQIVLRRRGAPRAS